MNFGICVARSGGWALQSPVDTRGKLHSGESKVIGGFFNCVGFGTPKPALFKGQL